MGHRITVSIARLYVKVRYLDTSGPSMAKRSTRPWERRHLLWTDWGTSEGVANVRQHAAKKAAKPTWDYETLYGSTTGLGATDSFIEDLYSSLTVEK